MSEPQKPETAAPEKVDETYTESKAKFEGKAKSEYFDPCQELAQKSIKCLHRNGGDRTMCGDYFQAYRDCKKAWVRCFPPSLRWRRQLYPQTLTPWQFDKLKADRKAQGAWW
ncbi:cytochrome c oxidase-assembly factor cox-23 [Colletotrichum acutatum]